MKKFLIIPKVNDISESLNLVKEFDAGFEYNDFCMPWVLDDEKKLAELKSFYKGLKELPSYTTSHGAFFDVLVFSDDKRIKEVSELRVRQSIKAAVDMNCKGIVFHSNINPLLVRTGAGVQYVNNWLKANSDFYHTVAKEFPQINIYLENMFDQKPDYLEALGKEMKDVPNFGICFDYAHALISETDTKIWAEKLSPYIRHVHINDNDKKSDLHLAIGDGATDWNKFSALEESCFPDATVLIETSSIENQKKSFEYLYSKIIK